MEADHSSLHGCHKVARSGDVDQDGQIVDSALRARITSAVASGSATRAEEQVAAVGRMLSQTPAGQARAFWGWDA